MKQLFKSMWVMAAAAMAFTACSKDETEDIMPQEEKVTITINADNEVAAPESRTNYNGTQQIKWNTTGEVLEVLQKDAMGISAEKTTKCTTDGTTATFDVQFAKAQAGDQFTYYAIYPAVNYETNNTNVTDFKLVLPDAQNATKTSFDPDADLLVAVAQGPMAQPQSLNFSFRRPIAFAELTVKGINAGEKILNVTFENKTADLAGRMKFNMDSGVAGEIGYSNTGKKSLTINYTDYVAEGADKIYFTTFPAMLKDFTITVNTDKAVYTKAVTIADASRHIALKSNTMTRFAVNNLTRTEATQTIKPGNYVIIAEREAKYYGMTSVNYANKGERLEPAVLDDFSTDLLSYLPKNENLIWTISGDDAQGYTLKQGALYLVSDVKKLFTTDKPQTTAPTAFTLSAGETAGTHKLTDGTSGRVIALNTSTSYFSMYASGQVDNLYIVPAKEDTRPLLATPTVEAVADQNNVTVSWNKIEGAGSYTVTCGTTTYTTKTAEELQYTFNDLAWETTHKFEVVAKPAVVADYKPSKAGIAEVTLGAAPKPADALADGPYVIMYKDAGKFYAMHDTKESTYSFGSEVIAWDGTSSTITTDNAAITWNIEFVQGHDYAIKHGNQYLKNTGKSHYNTALETTTTPQNFTIVKNADGATYSIKHGTDVFGWRINKGKKAVEFGFNATGTNANIYLVPIKVLPKLDAPTITIGTITDNTIALSWTSVANAGSYNVLVDNEVKHSGITATNVTLEGLSAGTTYTITVVANPADATAYQASEATAKVKTTGVSTKKIYTVTIDATAFGTISGSGYAPFNKQHTITAEASDKTTVNVIFESNQVMKNGNNLQFKKKEGIVSSVNTKDSNWGTIKEVTCSDTSLKVTITGSKDSFTVKNTNSKAAYSTITVKFEK